MSVFSILLFIFWTLFIASAACEIAGYHKKNIRMEHIAKPCMYVFLLAASLMILIPLIPDSISVIIYGSLALLFALAGALLQFFPKKHKTVILSSACFILNFLCYIKLLSPSFKLFSLPFPVTVIISLIYLSALVFFYFYVIGKRNKTKTAGIIIFMLPLMILHYGSIITLTGQPKLYSALLFTGTTVFIASNAMIVKGFFKPASEKDRLIRMCLYIAGQFFVTAGYTLMVSF